MASDVTSNTDADLMKAALIEYQTRLHQLGLERAQWLRQTRDQTRRLWFLALDLRLYTGIIHQKMHELEASVHRAEEVLALTQPAPAGQQRTIPGGAPVPREQLVLLPTARPATPDASAEEPPADAAVPG